MRLHGFCAPAATFRQAGQAAALAAAAAAIGLLTSQAAAHRGPTCPPAAGCGAACSHTSAYEQAMQLLMSRAENPGAVRLNLALHNARRAMCFPPDLTPEELADIMEQYALLPPTEIWEGGLRYFTQSTVWTGDVTSGSSGRAQRARLTYSFVPDGATWDNQPNTLNATLTNVYGAGNEDRGKEFMRQAFANWARHGGLVFQEVADNGSNRSSSMSRSSLRGDIRIGGNARGTPNYLAYNYYPASGGDMLINTSYFNPGSSMGSSSNNFRYLRNVIAHEHGHGLGYPHAVPCENNKLMEPYLSTAFDMLTIDERRGAGRNYGDRFSGNNSAATAVDFGDLTTPILRSVIERDLSTNGAAGTLSTGQDWFRFTLTSPQPVTITVVPTGGTYNNGLQSSGCDSSQINSIVASQAGNLDIELRNSAGTTVLQSAAAAPAGQTETLSAGTLAAGTYTIRVFDVGPNAHQIVQLYDLAVRVGPGNGAAALPQAVAGVNKRCQADVNCFFMGNLNSRALEPGASIPASGYAWDLDGDGTFEVVGQAQPSRTYPSNGIYTVTLRVTDSNGRAATDSITVTVWGATTEVSSAIPSIGDRGQIVPITITGRNFKNVTMLNMVAVSGGGPGAGGVSLIGTPVPNALGTEITGLSLVIASDAVGGPRNLTVTNLDGSHTGVGVFTVNDSVCPGDWNQDGAVNSTDISAFIADWLASVQTGTLTADFNNDGVVNSQDISHFISAWLESLSGDC